MRTSPEAKMRIIASIGIEPVWICEAFPVAVAGSEQKDERCTFRNRRSRNVDFGQGLAGAEMDRRLEPQQLIDNAWRKRGVLVQPLQPFAMAQQREHAIGDEVDGGLVSGDQQKHGGGEEIVVAHPSMPFVLGDRKARQHVGRRPLALLLDESAQIIGERVVIRDSFETFLFLSTAIGIRDSASVFDQP